MKSSLSIIGKAFVFNGLGMHAAALCTSNFESKHSQFLIENFYRAMAGDGIVSQLGSGSILRASENSDERPESAAAGGNGAEPRGRKPRRTPEGPPGRSRRRSTRCARCSATARAGAIC